jgi:hypothetical protein
LEIAYTEPKVSQQLFSSNAHATLERFSASLFGAKSKLGVGI